MDGSRVKYTSFLVTFTIEALFSNRSLKPTTSSLISTRLQPFSDTPLPSSRPQEEVVKNLLTNPGLPTEGNCQPDREVSTDLALCHSQQIRIRVEHKPR